MKKALYALLFIILPLSIYCQETLEQGYIRMEITDLQADDAMNEAQLAMMKGTTTNYYFTQEKTMVVQNFMGGMGGVTTVTDNNTGAMVIFFNMMEQKIMIKSSKDEMRQMTDSTNMSQENVKIVTDKSDRKTIAGYDCYKVTVSNFNINDVPVDMVLYATDKIKIENDVVQNLNNLEIEGFPLEMTLPAGPVTITISATEIKKDFDWNMFNIDTTDYEEMTFSEFKDQMGMFGN